jgi:CheY-like chemotaxis protein
MAPDPLDIQPLQDALRHLYDPVELRRSPLAGAFATPAGTDVPTGTGGPPGDEAPAALRRILIEAIQSLQPPMRLPQASRAWRIYHVLAYRYIEQSTQKQVAAELGLGIRQLRRLEVAALQALAETLESHRGSATPRSPSLQEKNTRPESPSLNAPPDAEQELALLKKTSPSQVFELKPFLENILRTVAPLMESLQVSLVFIPDASLSEVYGQLIPIRHGIINVLSAVGQSVAGGSIQLTFAPEAGGACLQVAAAPPPEQPLAARDQLTESVKLGQRLVALSAGSMSLAIEPGGQPGLTLRVSLPLSSPRVVLALDDNLDALRLFERYLAGSAYRLSGLQDPSLLISTAETLGPDIILLDVMLPGVDGWELLGRLREHPRLGKIPVIVSTILPQESLALALGAAAFLKKPVSQESFLQALDRLLAGSQGKESP